MVTSFLDSDIEREVRRLLRQDSTVEIADLEVEVADGTVRLSGTAADRRSRRQAVRIAASVSGVLAVRQDLHGKEP